MKKYTKFHILSGIPRKRTPQLFYSVKERQEYAYNSIVKRGLSYQHKYPIKKFSRDYKNSSSYYLA